MCECVYAAQVWLKMQRLKTNHKSAASQAAHIQRRLFRIWGRGASVMCFMAYESCARTHTHARARAHARARRWQLSQYCTLDYTEFPLVVPDVVLTRWLVYKVSS